MLDTAQRLWTYFGAGLGFGASPLPAFSREAVEGGCKKVREAEEQQQQLKQQRQVITTQTWH